ncbi:MAG TPA: hypothetical protein VFJ18_11205 [Pararhizobium sp.]|nr:hypothetical protein [Pararhizobium sp.]
MAFVGSVALALVASTGAANAAGVLDQLFPSSSQGCMDMVKVSLKEAIRSGIDKEVKRHEAALKKPPSLSDLGCLDNLFNVNLDFAVQVPNLTNIFKSAVSNAEQQICSYAQAEWNKATQPLQSALQLPSFSNLHLPNGGSGSGGPELNFNYDRSSGQLDLSSPPNPNTGPREDIYRNLYGSGGQ